MPISHVNSAMEVRFKNQWTGSCITVVPKEGKEFEVSSQRDDPNADHQVWNVFPQVREDSTSMQTGLCILSCRIRSDTKLVLTFDPESKSIVAKKAEDPINNCQLWNLSKNEMRCAACPEYQLSLPNNANGSKYSLKKFNPSAWGGSHQKFDFVVADLLDFDKVRCCADMLRNVMIKFNEQKAFLTCGNSRSRDSPVKMAFDKRESFENNQKFNIIPTPDDANTRNFHVESVRLPGYYLQVAQDGNNNSKDAQMQIFNNQFQRWNLKKNQLSCSGGSFYGMIIGNKIDFYLTEIYNFSETPSIPGKLCMDDLDSAFIETVNKLRSKLRHAREQANWLCLLQFNRMCLKYTPNTSRGTKFKMISLINLMEQKNASYANDMFAVEKNGLSLKHYDECIEEAGYTMHKAAQYVSCTPQTPGNQGFPFAFWMLLHYVTVQASDEDARICAAIIANYFLTFYHNDRSISDFAVQLKEHSLYKVTNNQSLVLWLWQIHVGMVQNGKHKKESGLTISAKTDAKDEELGPPMDNDIAYLSNLYPREHAKPAEALEKLEETFHPLAMVFSENEEWLPDDGEEIILTAPPTVQSREKSA